MGYLSVLSEINQQSDEIVYDLYLGAGTIAIYISKRAKEIFAFESVKSAISSANINAGLNDIQNVSFINADLYTLITEVL